MSTMADTITRQVTEQVRRALEMTGTDNRPNPLEHPTLRAGLSCQQEPMSLCPADHAREGLLSDRTNRLLDGRQGGRATLDIVGQSERGWTVASATASTPYATRSQRTDWLEE